MGLAAQQIHQRFVHPGPLVLRIICVIGVKVGNVFGEKYKSKAELAGGLILIVMGAKILIDHLFF